MNCFNAYIGMRCRAFLAVFFFCYCGAFLLAVDFFELGPIRYSDSRAANVVSKMSEKGFRRERAYGGDLEFLKSVLRELDVPMDSQCMVYSKTSAQKGRIFPRYPRAIYFSDSVYVGYVPGGDLEVITHDEKLGLVFYLVKPLADGDAGSVREVGYEVVRRKSCLSCHVSSVTGDVPGLLVRSVFTDKSGEVDFKRGSHYVDDTTAVDKRWGGWYVTGNWSGLTHMGNDFNGNSGLSKLGDLGGRVELSRYPRGTSDVAALMVLEHQCKIHSLMVEVKMVYQRSLYLEKALAVSDMRGGGSGASFKAAKRGAEDVVAALLFSGEADIGGSGVEGGKAFKKSFMAGAKKSKSGKHLRKLRLYGRMFKYRCSYMIHSKAFLALPEVIKGLIFVRLHEILSADDPVKGFGHLQSKEREVILEILGETTAMYRYVK